MAYSTTQQHLTEAAVEFWTTYYASMRELHSRRSRDWDEPVKDRNLGTTDARHVTVFEQFWRRQLAQALGVGQSEVGGRTIQFREHRSKSFDVCWPLTGDPKILISVKSMQNAYRNFTNRIEEAFGDSAVLRLYRSNAVFGFFFFMLDGNVPRGLAEQGKAGEGDPSSGRGKGVAPFLDLIEEGGDFFTMTQALGYRRTPARRSTETPHWFDAIANAAQSVSDVAADYQGRSKSRTSQRQDVIVKAEQSLLDLAAEAPRSEGGIHYDAIAFVPARFQNLRRDFNNPQWSVTISPVSDRLDYRSFIARLLIAAQVRGLL